MSQTGSIVPGQIPTQPKGWLARRWKLLLGVLVALMVLGIAGVFGILTLIMSAIKGSDVAKEGMTRARSNPAVVQYLGTPIEEGWLVSGSINVSDGSGDANLSLPISGSKGKGTLYVIAQKSAGTWTYSLMQAAIEGSGQRIDLLAQSSMSQAPAPAPNAPAQTGAATLTPSAAAPPPALPAGPTPLVTGDTNTTGIVAEVTECNRKEGVLSVKVRLRNTGSAGKHVDIFQSRNYESYYLSAANKKYFMLKDSEGTYLTPKADGMGGLGVDVAAGGQYTWWAKFPAPPAEVKAVTLYTPLAAPLEDVPVMDK
jgi:hypothetical protein